MRDAGFPLCSLSLLRRLEQAAGGGAGQGSRGRRLGQIVAATPGRRAERRDRPVRRMSTVLPMRDISGNTVATGPGRTDGSGKFDRNGYS